MLAPTEQQDLPKPGDFVAAKYRVEEILGRGGMGAVFRVTHSVTGKSFAVKWLLPQYNGGQEMAQRFIREAQVAGRVDHPNIVEVYDIGEDRGSMYMVMELLQGESLATHISRVGQIPANQACQLMIPVTRGLAAAHRSGIIHRDLKPDNIFLSVNTLGEPRPKILDFGISKMSVLASDANPALTREGVVMGTPHYMAPEQLRSHKVDERCDIYALGVILYQMLTGKLPFTGDNFPDLMLKIISEPLVPLAKLAPDAPRDLIAIVETAMSRSAAERFDTVAALGRALEPFGDGALFDVEQALSTRPVPASVLPGPATPVATESRFPDTVAQPVSVVQRARRMAFPLAVSGVSAVLFSMVYASLGDPTKPTPASAAELRLDAPALQRSSKIESKPAGDAHSAAAQLQPDELPVPATTLNAPEPTAAQGGASEAPALIGALAPSEEEPIAATPTQAPAEALDQPQQLPAGLSAPPQTVETPVPIAPPGAAAPSSDSDPAKKQKKATVANKAQQAKPYENPELRLNDFL